MLEILNFVKAAVAKTDNRPILQCFRIAGGRITACNGSLAISAPFPVEFSCAPFALPFIKALGACESKETTSMHLDGGRLIIRSGRFKSVVDCMDEKAFPEINPEGPIQQIPSPMLPALRSLLPFVSTDESRPWACGVLFVNQSAFATNNISIVEHWIPAPFPAIANIPIEAIKELVRLGLEPHSLQMEPHKVTFHLPGGAWVTCSVSSHQWPDVGRMFEESAKYSGPFMEGEPLKKLLADCKRLSSFCVKDFPRLHFKPGEVSTMAEGGQGSSIETPHSPGVGVYSPAQLESLGAVRRVGWEAYPKAAPFFGDNFRGILAPFLR